MPRWIRSTWQLLLRSGQNWLADGAQTTGAALAFDTYGSATLGTQQRMAARRNIARWAWPCDDPRSLERLGLTVVESAAITRPPAGLRAQLPARYRYLLPLAHPLFGKAPALTLFRAG